MDGRVIAEMILHLGRIASGDGLVEGLTSGQWTVLRYFGRANRFSRTPSAFAAFHGTTRGTASQVIKSLVAQGYLRQTQSKTDGRSVQLDLTNKARAIIAKDPLEGLVRAAGALPPGVRGHFVNALQRTQCQVALDTDRPIFGTCGTCAHLERDGGRKQGQGQHACGFMNEPLSEGELEQLCIHFTPDRPAPPRTATLEPHRDERAFPTRGDQRRR